MENNNILFDFLQKHNYIGKENAVKCRNIAIFLQCDTRKIRKLREEWNKNPENQVKILTCNGGFYIPAWYDKEQVLMYARTLEHKALSMLKEVSMIKKAYKLDGQEYYIENGEIKIKKLY